MIVENFPFSIPTIRQLLKNRGGIFKKGTGKIHKLAGAAPFINVNK